jgi:long-chain acyl-CoA synthetase
MMPGPENTRSEVAIVDVVAAQGGALPERPFLTERGRTVTFGEFYTLTRRIAGFLRQHGVRAGDRVVLYVHGRLAHLLAYFGTMALGAIPVHLYAEKPHTFVAFAAEHTGARLVVSDSETLDQARLPCAAVQVPALEEGSGEAWSHERHPVAYMMFTSGTTGQPKAVQTTQRNVGVVTRNLIRMAGMQPGDREVIVLPLGSTGGLGHAHANLMLGNHAHLTSRSLGDLREEDLLAILALIEAQGITGFLATPGILGRFVDHHREAFQLQARGLRYVLANVAPMRPELVQELLELLPDTRFCTYYGLTEASRSVCQCYNDHPGHYGAAGLPTPGIEIRVDRPDLGTGIGEVQIRGANVMAGYWGQEALGPGAWFPTGDLGRFDDEGFLTIHGRVKDNVNIDGLKCFPFEIEAVLERHPAVRECAVVGVPDRITFQRLAAAVVPEQARDRESPGALVAALQEHCRQYLDPHKVPGQFIFPEGLPRTDLGKIYRPGVIEMLARGHHAG